MTWLLAAAAALAAFLLVLLAAAGRALILAATRHGRHEQPEEREPWSRAIRRRLAYWLTVAATRDRERARRAVYGDEWPEPPLEELPPERSQEELGFSAEPAPGLDIYTDRNVWLPHTPQPGGRTLWQPPWPPAPLHEPRAERKATDTDIRTVRQHVIPQPEPAITGHVITDADVPAGDGKCRCGLPAGHFADALWYAPLKQIDAMFAGQLTVVTSA